MRTLIKCPKSRRLNQRMQSATNKFGLQVQVASSSNYLAYSASQSRQSAWADLSPSTTPPTERSATLYHVCSFWIRLLQKSATYQPLPLRPTTDFHTAYRFQRQSQPLVENLFTNCQILKKELYRKPHPRPFNVGSSMHAVVLATSNESHCKYLILRVSTDSSSLR